MAITFLPQARAVLGDQTLNFAPLNAGLDSVIQGNRKNALMAENRRQFDERQKQQNALLDVQRQKLARGPERPWWAGQDGSIDPAMQRYRELGRPQTNVNVNTGEQSSQFQKKIGGMFAEEYMKNRQTGMTAQNDLNNLKVLEGALNDPNVYTGTGGKTVQSLKKAAQSLFGVPVEGVAGGELVDNLSKRLAIGLQQDLPLGKLSNDDRKFLLELAPGLSGTPEGNRRIVRLAQLQKQYQIERSRAALAYARQNNGELDQGFDAYLDALDSKYAERFGGLIKQLRSDPQEPQRPPTVGIDALRKQYGIE